MEQIDGLLDYGHDHLLSLQYKTKKCVFIAQKCGKSFLTYSELLLAQGPPLPSVVPPPPPSHEFAVHQLKGLPEQGGADVGSAASLRKQIQFFLFAKLVKRWFLSL